MKKFYHPDTLKEILVLSHLKWGDAGSIIIKEGHKISTATHLFEKIEDEKIQEQLTKLKV